MMEVFVSSPCLIDFPIYQLWVDGFSVEEALTSQLGRGTLAFFPSVPPDVLRSEICDQYRLFDIIEPILQSPSKLAEHSLVLPMTTQLQYALINRYYEFDAEVIREILGKKFSARNRKELDDVSDKTNRKLRSCQRQFDNMKRVFKTVEEMMGSLTQNIKANYLLYDGLAKKYAAVVFITNNRFETGKKRLSYLTFDDFVFCADIMITNWSYSAEQCKLSDMDVDFDKDFLMDLRELKVLLERDIVEEHKMLVSRTLNEILLERVSADMESSFKNISKLLVGIASNLNHSKEAKDLFVDIVEKFIEPLNQSKWSVNDVRKFLEVYTISCSQIDMVRKSYSHILPTWERYMNTLRQCIVKLYHS